MAKRRLKNMPDLHARRQSKLIRMLFKPISFFVTGNAIGDPGLDILLPDPRTQSQTQQLSIPSTANSFISSGSDNGTRDSISHRRFPSETGTRPYAVVGHLCGSRAVRR
jgi:hypothetical protein